MKKVGIVCDNYKLKKFKEELKKQGFDSFKTFPFTPGNTTIQVDCEDDKVNDVKNLCQKIELHFKRSN